MNLKKITDHDHDKYITTPEFNTLAEIIIFKGKGTLVQNDNDIIAGGPIVNICIVYKTSPKTINSNFVFKNCLFGAIKITNTTNSDTDK